MVNKVILLGNLGRDPEVRSTPSGRSVANFTLATSRNWKDRDGNRQEQTEWHQIVVWGRQAEVAGQYLTKGKRIFLEGRIQTRSWDDQQSGEKRYRTEIICDFFKMLGGGSGGGGGRGGYSSDPGPTSSFGAPQGGGTPPPQGGGTPPPEDDDIPF